MSTLAVFYTNCQSQLEAQDLGSINNNGQLRTTTTGASTTTTQSPYADPVFILFRDTVKAKFDQKRCVGCHVDEIIYGIFGHLQMPVPNYGVVYCRYMIETRLRQELTAGVRSP